MGVENSTESNTIGALLVAASKDYQTALVLVGQELHAFCVLKRVNVLILLVEKDGVGLRERVECFQDGVESLRAFRPVQQKSLFGRFDELRLSRLEDTRSARVLRFTKRSN